ncbi:MAG TPA: hypothetical protein PKW33_03440 [Anaerolineaceae bacterium]|nr:hypothetical protein [Anaerolineaceae bacterium]HPN50615.1 hypothetical protein [Anaerolineaceae bacterium]
MKLQTKLSPRCALILCAVTLMLAALACDLSGGGEEAKGAVLFQDDFSNPSSGWATVKDTDQIMAYEAGGFRIWVNKPNFLYWSVPGLKFSDVRVEVDAKKMAGPEDNDYGIICRYVDQENYYGFLISSDGYYGIIKTKNGEQNVFGGEGMRFSDLIKTGDAVNRVRADCIGSTLALYINGQQVDMTQDEDFTVGDVGLLTGSFDTAGVDILFDNFVVKKP